MFSIFTYWFKESYPSTLNYWQKMLNYQTPPCSIIYKKPTHRIKPPLLPLSPHNPSELGITHLSRSKRLITAVKHKTQAVRSDVNCFLVYPSNAECLAKKQYAPLLQWLVSPKTSTLSMSHWWGNLTKDYILEKSITPMI